MARVVFFGSPEFAIPSLRVLAGSEYAPVLVVTQPDRPAGRGKKARPTPVRAVASELGIPVITTSSLKDPALTDTLGSAEADFFVVAAFGLIFPKRLLEMPAIDCINVHASLLPAWRGASPVNMAIVNGDASSGISIMRMVSRLDAGPVYSREVVPIDPMEDAGSLSARLSVEGASLLLRTLRSIEKKGIEPEGQNEESASYAGLLKKEDGLVPWDRSAAEVHDHVRGMNPWPGSFTWHRGDYLKILRARPAGEEAAGHSPGEIVSVGDDGIIVACAEGTISIEALQAQGRRPLEAGDFLRGHVLVKGDRFGGNEDE
ncbi:MAG TPA: methionyl-tRNA formyltransferase [Candidatus Krumholzibacterium sp.]|nr:methionyl-tRNA formyltransferase [Candidatus Krumholzibacterium sp.]